MTGKKRCRLQYLRDKVDRIEMLTIKEARELRSLAQELDKERPGQPEIGGLLVGAYLLECLAMLAK